MKLRLLFAILSCGWGFQTLAVSSEHDDIVFEEKELFRLVIRSHKNNHEKIVAWQGSATVASYQGHGLDRKLTAEDKVHFVLDENADAIKWTINERNTHRLQQSNG